MKCTCIIEESLMGNVLRYRVLFLAATLLAGCGEKETEAPGKVGQAKPTAEAPAAPAAVVAEKKAQPPRQPDTPPGVAKKPTPQEAPPAARATGALTEKELDGIRTQYRTNENAGKKYSGRTYIATGKTAKPGVGMPFKLRINQTKDRMEIFSVWCEKVEGTIPVGETVTVSGTLSGEVYADDAMGESLFLTDCRQLRK